jgi:hypothetical protein
MAALRPFPGRCSRLLAFAFVLPLVVGCGTPARAVDRAEGRWLRMDVVDRASGQALPVWRHRGELFVAGSPGARYAVRVVNRSGERLLAVVSVDGINIVSGETAGIGQRGYVLSPWGRAALTGWRKSEREVAAFEFTALEDSYAARTGRPGDVGVIGIAVFREHPQITAQAGTGPSPEEHPPRAEPAPSTASRADTAPAAAAPDASGPNASEPGASSSDRVPPAPPPPTHEPQDARLAAGERLGTGHGGRETSLATTVPFERATSAPQEILRIRYDSLENLVAAGIAPRSLAFAGSPRPRAFPADDGFAADPPAR